MYLIQSLQSKRFFVDKGMWRVYGPCKFNSEEEARKIIRKHRLTNVQVILDPKILSTQDHCEIPPTENKETRYDKNLEFIQQLQQKAKFFKMDNVGVKTLNNAVVNEYMYTPRKHVSRRELYCKLPNRYDSKFHIIEYEITSPGRIRVTNYYSTKITPELDEKIAIIKVDYNEVVEKITISELKNVNKKLDRADTLVVDNPHMINKKVEPPFKEIVKPVPPRPNSEGVNQFNKQYSLLTYMHGEWYNVTYHHVRNKVIHIDKYRLSNEGAEHLEKVGVVSIDSFRIQLWGTREGKYRNSEGTIVETEVKEYIIDNSEELI